MEKFTVQQLFAQPMLRKKLERIARFDDARGEMWARLAKEGSRPIDWRLALHLAHRARVDFIRDSNKTPGPLHDSVPQRHASYDPEKMTLAHDAWRRAGREFKLHFMGYNQTEIARMTSQSQPVVSRLITDQRKELARSLQ